MSTSAVLLIVHLIFGCVHSHTLKDAWRSSMTWDKLEISPNPITSMPYADSRINIYEHVGNQKATNSKKYFYTPVSLLDHQTAIRSFNNITQQPEVRFRIELWNEHIENETAAHLSKVLDKKVESHQMQVIPFDKVVLVSSITSPLYTIPTDWTPCNQLRKSVVFSLKCFDQNDCDRVTTSMKTDPEQFHHLKLLFTLDSVKPITKEIIIGKEDYFGSGELAIKILQRFPRERTALLSSKDQRRLLNDITTEVTKRALEDFDVILPGSETRIYQTLQELLFIPSSSVTLDQENDIRWKSVVWHDDAYRPDKTCKMFNSVYKALSRQKRIEFLDFINNRNVAQNGIPFQMGFMSPSTMIREFFDNFNKIRDTEHVGWDGEHFFPKALNFNAVDLDILRNARKPQSAQSRTRNYAIPINYSQSLLSVPLRFSSLGGSFNSEEWDYFREAVHVLGKELKKLKNAKPNIGKIPTSCADLQHNQQTVSGLYLIKSLQSIQTVYCDFTQEPDRPNFQKTIGYNDIKTEPVYFAVKTSTPFSTTNVTIPFEHEYTNVGGFMDKNSGIFTAPRSGKYFFLLTGSASHKDSILGQCTLIVGLYVNDILYANSMTQFGFEGYYTNNEGFSLQLVLKLKAQDQVTLKIRNNVNAEIWISTFVGWLLEEDII